MAVYDERVYIAGDYQSSDSTRNHVDKQYNFAVRDHVTFIIANRTLFETEQITEYLMQSVRTKL